MVARAHHSSRVSFLVDCARGGGGPGKYSSRASYLACIMARIVGVGRTGETKLARIINRVHHCPHFREGEDRAIIARKHHRSRVSLFAYLEREA